MFERVIMYPVRNSVKAIIIRNNQLLCIQKKDISGFYYLLPGGGQEKNETFIHTLERECKEELGADVKVGKLLFIREYIGCHHEFKNTDDNHQVEFMFECILLSEPNILKATNLDDLQEGLEWIDLNNTKSYRVYPKVLIDRINSKYTELYWGDIN
jgi:8-oxo-dGTP diphosphatase